MVETGEASQPNRSPNIDISSPYFLSASDHPGQNFVGDNLLRDGNYSDWQNEMTNALFAKNKIGFVDGTTQMPSDDSPDLMNWKRCNALVRGWLVSAMEKEIKSSVKYANTARDIWIDLEERFGKENAPRAYELIRMITTIHQNDMTVSAYYTKLRGVWDEIQSISPTPTCSCKGCKCGIATEIGKMRDKERLYDFLMGLNEEYGAVKTQILSTDPLPTLGSAYHLVSQDEQQRQIGTARITSNETAAFQAFGRGNNKNFGNNQSSTKKRNEDRTCTHCQKTGHTVDGCFELVGYPEWWNPKNAKNASKPKTQPRAAAAKANDNPMQNLTKEDYDRLIQMLRGANTNESKHSTSVANMAGLAYDEPDWEG